MPPRKVVTGLPARRRLARRLGARAPPRRAQAGADRPVRRGRLDALLRRRLGGGSAPAPDRPRALHVVSDPELGRPCERRRTSKATSSCAPGRRSVLPRQVPLRDAARPARADRCRDRCGRQRARADGDQARRPELGAVALAAAASLAGGLPFLIVRKEAKEYGTSNRLEATCPNRARRVCLVEDVVTSGGAAIEAIEALREAGLRVSNAICVVDREEGGADELARQRCACGPLPRLRAPGRGKTAPQIRLVEPFRPIPLLGFRARSDFPVPTAGGVR